MKQTGTGHRTVIRRKKEHDMQNTTRFAKTLRTAIIGGALLAALAFGSVSANGNQVGLTECDHGCTVSILSGQSDELAQFQVVDVQTADISAYVANGPGEIGFTR
jgi:hypothetical protein